MPSLNSLTVCLSHSWGGLEKVALQDALDISAQGMKVKFLCLEGSPIHEQLKMHSLESFPLDFQPRNYFDFKLKKVLQDWIAQGGNLIHTHQTTLLASIAPWLFYHPKVALLATRHIMNNHGKKDFFHQLIYSRVDLLLVMSEALRRNVVDTHAIRERKVKIVNLGLDFSLFDPAQFQRQKQRAQWGVHSDETIVIGMVGRIDPAKGQDTFIKAAAGLLSHFGPEAQSEVKKDIKKNEKLGKGKSKISMASIKFVIVGEETLGSSAQYLDELQKMVAQFHLEGAVVFAGYQSNIPEVMRAFDLFVMPSLLEAFGLVAIEAMAMECPIIISSGGSSSEIVGNQEFGLLMRSQDAFDLQQKLRYLIENPEERKLLGEKARKHVLTFYNRKNRVARTLGLYERSLRLRRVV